MLIIVERYREIKPVYQTIGRKFKKGIEEKPSKHIGYWRNKKIVNCWDGETKEWSRSIKENVGRSNKKKVWNLGIEIK